MRPSLRARRPPTSSPLSKTRGLFFLGGLHVEHACRDVRVRTMHVLPFLLPTYCYNSSSPAFHSMSLPSRLWHYTHSMYYCRLRSLCLRYALRCPNDVSFSPNVTLPVAVRSFQEIRNEREHLQISCTLVDRISYQSRGTTSWLCDQTTKNVSHVDQALELIMMF